MTSPIRTRGQTRSRVVTALALAGCVWLPASFAQPLSDDAVVPESRVDAVEEAAGEDVEAPLPEPEECPVCDEEPASDIDGDGVYDAGDECPMTPPGALVDGDGCAADEQQELTWRCAGSPEPECEPWETPVCPVTDEPAPQPLECTYTSLLFADGDNATNADFKKVFADFPAKGGKGKISGTAKSGNKTYSLRNRSSYKILKKDASNLHIEVDLKIDAGLFTPTRRFTLWVYKTKGGKDAVELQWLEGGNKKDNFDIYGEVKAGSVGGEPGNKVLKTPITFSKTGARTMKVKFSSQHGDLDIDLELP